MTTIGAEASLAGSQARPRVRDVAAVVAGNAVEVYDFLAYAFFARQIAAAFFPAGAPSASLLAALAAFGAGFLARPLGALVIGRLADRAGRGPAMRLSFTIMGVATLGLAVTPTHAAIGWLAPALVVLFRLMQGFAFGGEFGSSTAFLLETAPERRRGVMVSLQYMSQDVGIVAAGLAGLTLATLLSADALDGWGWRIAFLVGAVVIPVGYLLRRGLPEPARARDSQIAPASGRLWRTSALAILLLASGTVATYVQAYLTTYAATTLRLSAQASFVPAAVTGAVGMAISPLGGWLSDRYGRRPVIAAPLLALLLAAAPGYWWLAETRSLAVLAMWAALVSVCLALSITAAFTWVAEAMPTPLRGRGVGLAYAVAVAVFGGSTQFVVAGLIKATGSPLAPAWCIAAAAAAGLAAAALIPETAPARRRAS